MQGKVLLPIGLDRLAEVCPRHPRCCLLHLMQAPGGEELKQLILHGPTPMVERWQRHRELVPPLPILPDSPAPLPAPRRAWCCWC